MVSWETTTRASASAGASPGLRLRFFQIKPNLIEAKFLEMPNTLPARMDHLSVDSKSLAKTGPDFPAKRPGAKTTEVARRNWPKPRIEVAMAAARSRCARFA
jgi:hypothetical protein